MGSGSSLISRRPSIRRAAVRKIRAAEALCGQDQRVRDGHGVVDAHPLLDRVRALAARAEHHGRDARGGDEGGVRPVRRAGERRRRAEHLPAAAWRTVWTISASRGTSNGSRTSSVRPATRPDRRPRDQRLDLRLDVPHRLAGERAALEAEHAAPGVARHLGAALDQRGVDRAAAEQGCVRVPERRVQIAERGQDRPGLDDRVHALSGREPWAARPLTSISTHTKPLWATISSSSVGSVTIAASRLTAPSTSCTPRLGVLLVGHRGDHDVAAEPGRPPRGRRAAPRPARPSCHRTPRP